MLHVVLKERNEAVQDGVFDKAVAIEFLRVDDVHSDKAAAVNKTVVGEETCKFNLTSFDVGIPGGTDTAQEFLVLGRGIEVDVNQCDIRMTVSDNGIAVADDAADTEHLSLNVKADGSGNFTAFDGTVGGVSGDSAQEAVALHSVKQRET